VRALAVPNDWRLPELPDAPTIKEGVIDHDVASTWQGRLMTGGREPGDGGLRSGRQHMMDKERGNE
jgi:hypothetical protein